MEHHNYPLILFIFECNEKPTTFMKENILSRLLWSAVLGLGMGWLAGTVEFLVSGRDRVVGGGKEALISIIYVSSFYSFVWLVIIMLFSFLILLLSYLTRQRQGFSEKFLDLKSHLLGAGVTLFFYVYFLMPINNRLLPPARDPKSIIGNLLFIIICMMFSFLLYYIFLMLSVRVKSMKLSGVFRYLAILLSLVAIINILVTLLSSPKDWLVSGENEKLRADAAPGDFNAVLITIDALRADHLSCYGYHRSTPVIDSLARAGSLFEHAISQAPWTFPSFISMMTSLYPETISNCERVALDPARTTLAEVLSANGVGTAAFLSNPCLVNLYNVTQGFDYVSHAYQQPVFMQNIVGSKLYDIIGEINAKLFLREDAEILVERALSWLEKNKDGRFFLWIHFIEPHVPYGDPWNNLWPSDPAYHGKIGRGWDEFEKFYEGRTKLNDADISHLKFLYDGDIHYVDYHLEGFFNYLKQQNLWDKTLIILTSDHGEEFLEHGRLIHGIGAHAELVRVPLIIKLPGQNEARTIPGQVQLLDLAPSVLDVFGLPPAKDMMGRSLLPVIGGQERDPRPAFSSCSYLGHRIISIRYENYALIYNEDKNSFRVYDIETDPLELRNIYETQRGKSDLLWKMLESHRQRNLTLSGQLEKIWESKKSPRFGYGQKAPAGARIH